MVMQLPASQLISLFAQLTDEQYLQSVQITPIPTRPVPRQCKCGHHSAEMADLRERFVPPRLDL
jgi:hypothetical protein